MNKMFVRVTLCVLALSLVSLAADRTTVTTKPVKGGHATKVETPRPDTVYLLNNFDDNTTGTYYCCSGNIIVGPNNTDGESPYNEAIQFTVSSASHITAIATAVNYILAGTSTTFELNIEADASGVPSGTPINTHPYSVTLDSQTFGQCCEVESKSCWQWLESARRYLLGGLGNLYQFGSVCRSESGNPRSDYRRQCRLLSKQRRGWLLDRLQHQSAVRGSGQRDHAVTTENDNQANG